MSINVGIEVTRADTTALYTLGAVAVVEANGTTPEKHYKYVQYNAATAAAAGVAGEVTYYYLAGGTQDNVVTSDVSDSVNIGAGVLQAALADGEYGWIQTRGPATLTIALTAGADGNALTAVGAGDGTLDVSGLVTDYICAVADDASANEIVCLFPE